MKFLKESDNGYWEVDLDKMRLYNYFGGWHEIDENSEEWLEGHLIEAEDWHDLYTKTGFIPFLSWEERKYTDKWDCWVSPNGELYFCAAHECAAEDLCEIIYGLTYNHGYGIISDAGDELYDRGWRKGSRYFNELHYSEEPVAMTAPQAEAMEKYCKWLGIPYPKYSIYIVKENNII